MAQGRWGANRSCFGSENIYLVLCPASQPQRRHQEQEAMPELLRPQTWVGDGKLEVSEAK